MGSAEGGDVPYQQEQTTKKFEEFIILLYY